jgi:hypothetical protein
VVGWVSSIDIWVCACVGEYEKLDQDLGETPVHSTSNLSSFFLRQSLFFSFCCRYFLVVVVVVVLFLLVSSAFFLCLRG